MNTALKDCLVSFQICAELLKYWLIHNRAGKMAVKMGREFLSIFSILFATRKGIQPIKSFQRFPWEDRLGRPVEDSLATHRDGGKMEWLNGKRHLFICCMCLNIVAFAVEGASWCRFHTGMDCT